MENMGDEFYQVQFYQGNKNLCPVVFADEHFEPHPKYPRYLVSTYGRVYDTKLGFMKTPRRRKGSYVTHHINTAPKRYSRIVAHRLVMETFDPIENEEEMVVNHKDLNKWNNKLENLEWTTPQGNVIHAYDNGAMPLGEDVHTAKHTNAEAEKVCKLLEKGLSYDEICNEMNYDKSSKIAKNFLYSIKNHVAWTRISEKYNF